MSPENEGGPPERPDYKVYRSRRGFKKPDLQGLRSKTQKSKAPKDAQRGAPAAPGVKPERSTARRVIKWVAIGVGVWILISMLAFAISSQLQSTKLADGVTDELSGNPLLLFSGQTILVIGTDARPSGLASEGETASDKCLEAAGQGEVAPSGCVPARADTLLLIRAGGTSFRKLSIPRDTQAEIPGQAPQKINGSYAFGGAKLTVETVENFLGLDIDHVAIVDFVGFRDFIDAIGGIEVDLDTPVCVDISGGEENGGFSLDLPKGESELNGDEALTLARTRSNTCSEGSGAFGGTDIERAKFQQIVLSGIKGRLTSPTRLPYNFLKGPIIGWNAPKAFVSDMGALIMPQLIFSAALGGDADTDVLTPTGLTDPLVVAQEECDRAVKKFLGTEPPRDPACSPE